MLRIFRRLYHDGSSKSRMPVARIANKRISNTIKRKLDSESQPKSRDHGRMFEPFPFAITEENKVEIMKRTILPLIDTPYEEQLAAKETQCRNSLRYLAQELYKMGTPIRMDIRKLPCHVNPIVPSPVLTQCRNKDEFSIWKGHDGQTETVGYMAFPISKHGDTVCIEPNGCDVMKKESIQLCDILQEFIRTQKKVPVSYSLGEHGGWRRFMMQINSLGHLMITGILNPRNLRVQEVLDEKENFKEFIVQRANQVGLNLKSIYFQPCPHNRCSHTSVPFEHLYGDKSLVETINQYKFFVLPDSYMPSNSKGAEVLYKTVRKTIEENFLQNDLSGNVKPLVLNGNCGIGIMAVHLADIASKVIGVDINSQSIEAANKNAELNEVTNSEFICANLEIVLERILEKYSRNCHEMIVVLNAPKTGVHDNVIHTIRECNLVKKILYTSPKIGGEDTIDNLVKLCMKKAGKRLPPFIPISATPVDVVPHTEAYDTLLALERLPQE